MVMRALLIAMLSVILLAGCASTTIDPSPVNDPSAETDAPKLEEETSDTLLAEPLPATELSAETVTVERLDEHPDHVTNEADLPESVPEPDAEDAETAAVSDDSEAALEKVDVGLPFPEQVKTCPRMTIHNRPEEDADANIIIYHKIAVINTVPIALAPIAEGCFSSGFGIRGDHLHKGSDYYHSTATEIYAAGSGTIVEATYRDDYGRMLLIDHSHGVFTRYAHLQEFGDDIEVGAAVDAGQIVGLMGNTASYSIPRHLHYEVLIGNYDTPKKSFGLDPIDIYTH